MTKEDMDKACALIVVNAIMVSGNKHSVYWYICELSHLFQALYGKQNYEYFADYAKIWEYVKKNPQYLIMTRKAG